MNTTPLPPALQGVPHTVLEEYVQARLSSFVDMMVQRLLHHEPSLNPLIIQRSITDVLAFLPPTAPPPFVPPQPVQLPQLPQQQYQLVFRHDCMALGCLDPQCAMCQHNPQRRCTVNFDRKYLVNDVLKAKCSATIRVELIERDTGRLVDADPPGLRLEVCVLDGHAYDTKFLEGGRVVEGGCEPEDELEACCLLLNKKKNTPLLVSGAMANNDTSGRLILMLQHGRAVLPDVSITDSSEAILLGRKPPFRLLVRANWLSVSSGARQPPRAHIRHAISEGFVVATRRTRTAGKVDIPSVDDPISKLEHMGKETVKKLSDIALAAQQAGVDIRIPENSVTKVGDFKQLALRAEQDGHLRQRLQHVLKLSKEKWDEAREHAMRAVVADSRLRAWYADPHVCELGLLFNCRLGSVDLERPMALLQVTPSASGRSGGGESRAEATAMSQLTPAQRDIARQLLVQAAHSWWRHGHPGWAIFSDAEMAAAPTSGPGNSMSGMDGSGGGNSGVHEQMLALGAVSSAPPAPPALMLPGVSMWPGPPGAQQLGPSGNSALGLGPGGNSNKGLGSAGTSTNSMGPAGNSTMSLGPSGVSQGRVGPSGPSAGPGGHPGLFGMHSGGPNNPSAHAPQLFGMHSGGPNPGAANAPQLFGMHSGNSGASGLSGPGAPHPATSTGTMPSRPPTGPTSSAPTNARNMNPFADVAVAVNATAGSQHRGHSTTGNSSPTHSNSGAQRGTNSGTSGHLAKRSATDMLMNNNPLPVKNEQQQGTTDVPPPSNRDRVTGSRGASATGLPPGPGPQQQPGTGPQQAGAGPQQQGLMRPPSPIQVAVPPQSPVHAASPEPPNPFASLMAAHHVVGGPGERGMSGSGGGGAMSPYNRSGGGACPTQPTFDLGALPSLPYQSMMQPQQRANGSSAGGSGGQRQQQQGGGPQGDGQGNPINNAAFRGLPSIGVGSFLGSADLDAVLGGLGAPSVAQGALGDMETSLTVLGLGNSLNLLGNNLAAFLEQGGASAWIPQTLFQASGSGAGAGGWQGGQQLGQGGSGGGAQGSGQRASQGGYHPVSNGMDGLGTVTSGLDNMQSIEQALPTLDNDATQRLLAAAQQASQAARSANR